MPFVLGVGYGADVACALSLTRFNSGSGLGKALSGSRFFPRGVWGRGTSGRIHLFKIGNEWDAVDGNEGGRDGVADVNQTRNIYFGGSALAHVCVWV